MIEKEDLKRVIVTTGDVDPIDWITKKAGISLDGMDALIDYVLYVYEHDMDKGLDPLINLRQTLVATFQMGWEVRDQIGRL